MHASKSTQPGVTLIDIKTIARDCAAYRLGEASVSLEEVLATAVFCKPWKTRAILGSLAKHFLNDNNGLFQPRQSGGLGVGSSNLPAPTNHLNRLGLFSSPSLYKF